MDIMTRNQVLRGIPPVQEILEGEACVASLPRLGREVVLSAVRRVIDRFRVECNDEYIKSNRLTSEMEVREWLESLLVLEFNQLRRAGLKQVVNATGIILHTNLGRAPLPQEAVYAMADVARGYSNLEYDLETGSRGSRHDHMENLIIELTGAEAAMVVNNNAAAVFLCLNTLAAGKEVIVSRGQQVEIGGSFRIPDIITGSGAQMVEVGTTNKTHLEDYEREINSETALLLRVHTSNYKITGFTEEVSCGELAQLGLAKHIAVMEDLGSGCLIDLRSLGLPEEPTVQQSLRNGVDIVTFSGDKLLGGPQAGIIAGKKVAIDRIKKNPLARMVRCDKSSIASLAAILKLYLSKDDVVSRIPTLRMIAYKEEQLRERAQSLEAQINETYPGAFQMEILQVSDEMGGGSLPGVSLGGIALSLMPNQGTVLEIQERMRLATVPVVCRIHQDRLLLHMRTIQEGENDLIVQALGWLKGQIT